MRAVGSEDVRKSKLRVQPTELMQILVAHLSTAPVGIDDTDECAADLNIACDCNGQCKPWAGSCWQHEGRARALAAGGKFPVNFSSMIRRSDIIFWKQLMVLLTHGTPPKGLRESLGGHPPNRQIAACEQGLRCARAEDV